MYWSFMSSPPCLWEIWIHCWCITGIEPYPSSLQGKRNDNIPLDFGRIYSRLIHGIKSLCAKLVERVSSVSLTVILRIRNTQVGSFIAFLLSVCKTAMQKRFASQKNWHLFLKKQKSKKTNKTILSLLRIVAHFTNYFLCLFYRF